MCRSRSRARSLRVGDSVPASGSNAAVGSWWLGEADEEHLECLAAVVAARRTGRATSDGRWLVGGRLAQVRVDAPGLSDLGGAVREQRSGLPAAGV